MGIASDYARAHLGISFDHPLSGALQECALLCFVDPFLCPDCLELQWDAIYPGLAFQRAVQRLASGSLSIPESLHGAYEVAYQAYGLDSNRHWHAACHRIVELTQEPAKQTVLDRSDAILPGPDSVVHEFQRSFFLAALRLRSDHPSIFYEPQLYFPPPWNRFVSVSLPPLLVNPGGIDFLRIEDNRSARVIDLSHYLSERPRRSRPARIGSELQTFRSGIAKDTTRNVHPRRGAVVFPAYSGRRL